MRDWKGVFPAVTTKMTKRGKLDLDAMQVSLDRLIGNGVSGIIVLPMLGENACLNMNEREKVIRGAAEVARGRLPLLSGLAEISLDNARRHSLLYKKFGADGLMVFPSLNYRTDPRETVHWYRSIASATSMPIMVYNNPIAYGVDVTPAILEQLSSVEEIVCIKEETGDSRRVTDIFTTLGDRYAVFCGIDDLVLESVTLGATGWVSGMANAWPAECVELFNLCANGEISLARALNRILMPAFHLDTQVKLVQHIKLAESLVYGAPEWTRAPRLPLTGTERKEVTRTIIDTIETLNRRDRTHYVRG